MKAAAMDNIDAVMKLAKLTEFGSPYVKINRAAAKSFYAQAVRLQNIDADFQMTEDMMKTASSALVDLIVNTRLLAMADKGHTGSQILLAERMVSGTQFYAPNNELANIWFLRAALEGSPKGLLMASEILYPGETNIPKSIKILEYSAKKEMHLPTIRRLG